MLGEVDVTDGFRVGVLAPEDIRVPVGEGAGQI